MNYDLTVSIVTYNTEKEILLKILECLQKIKVNIKIFISDNSEKDNIKEIIEELNDKRIDYIFNNSNNGFGAGHNVIINKILKKEVYSKYHLIINADIYFEEGIIENILNYMDNNIEIGQIGPKIKGTNGEITNSCKLIPTPINLIVRRFIPIKKMVEKIDYDYEMKWYNHENIMEVPILSGCFIFLRTEVFSKIGKFDERYFLYLEDYDFCRRVGKEYKVVYYPEVEIVHQHGKESYKSKKMLIVHVKSAIKYFNKWGWIFDNKRKQINKKIKEKYKNTILK